MEINEKELVKNIKDKFNFYIPGDMKKLTKYLKNETTLDIVKITHNDNYMGCAMAQTVIDYWDGDDEEDLVKHIIINWG